MGFDSFNPNRTKSYASELRTGMPGYNYRLRERSSFERMLSYQQPKVNKGKSLQPISGLTTYSDSHLTSLLAEARSSNKEARANKILRILKNRQSRKRKKEKGIPHDKKLKPLPCYHEKLYAEQIHWDDYPGGLRRKMRPYGLGYGYAYPGGQAEFPHEALLAKVQSTPLEKIVSEAIKSLTFNITPRAKDLIPFSVNFFQQLIELRENLALPIALKNAYKHLGTSGKRLDGVAESWLGANWGVLPLSNDAMELYKLLTTFKDNVDNWNKNLTSVLFRRRRKAIIPLNDLFPPVTAIAGGTNAYNVRRSIKYNAQLEVYYTIQFYPSPISNDDMLGILADRLGLMRPLSGLWEGVPWSWLIDYGVGIGDWLATKEPQFQLPFITKTRIESFKFTITEEATLSFNAFSETGELVVVPQERVGRYEFYRRVIKEGDIKNYTALVWQPQVSLSLGKGLNARRLANLAAVIKLNTSARLDRKSRDFLRSVKRAKYFRKVSKRVARKNMKLTIRSLSS